MAVRSPLRTSVAVVIAVLVAAPTCTPLMAASAAPPFSAAVNGTWSAPLPPTYMGFNIDEGTAFFQETGFLTSEVLPVLVSNLQPARIRFGGTQGDEVVYNLEDPSAPWAPGTLTQQRWTEVQKFLAAGDTQCVFGLNEEAGRANSSEHVWDPTPTTELIKLTIGMGDASRVAAWELGNEPNCYNKSFRIPITPEGVADNFATLNSILVGAGVREQYLLAGPDAEVVGDPQVANSSMNGRCGPHMSVADFFDFMTGFVRSAGPMMDVITYHYYPESHHWPDASPEEMLTPAFMDRMHQYSDRIVALRDQYAPHAQVWLGETAAYWGSGLPNATNAFADILFYADKASYLAVSGHQGVFRQTLFGGNYGLIELGGTAAAPTFVPNPSYYFLALWKQLVGDAALRITVTGGPATSTMPVRVYGYCAKAGGVVYLLLNPSSDAATVAVPASGNTRREWHLTSGDGALSSHTVRLNGASSVLSVDSKGNLPSMPASTVAASEVVRMAPQSAAFVTVTSVPGVAVCGGTSGDSATV